MNYYNEFNTESAAMIKQMMADGLIPQGEVDTRSITEVTPNDLKGYTQCHFFAGIAGWSFALQLAQWPSTRPVWTGSAPCQPYSTAGKRKGKEDKRHLFPTWLNLIRQCRPPTIFGEQVASAITHGWLDDVYEGLESEGYAVGTAVLPACSVGAPHRRDRLWFVGHSAEFRREQRGKAEATPLQGHSPQRTGQHPQPGEVWELPRGLKGLGGHAGNVDHTKQPGLEGHARYGADGHQPGRFPQGEDGPVTPAGFWDGGEWQEGWDGKARLIKPGIPLLVDGVQHKRAILHALGNAIVPQLAAEFIKASM